MRHTGQTDYVHLDDCVLLRTTDMAAHVSWNGSQYWFPFSQMAEGEEDKIRGMKDARGSYDREPFTLTVSEWIAEQKGIESE